MNVAVNAGAPAGERKSWRDRDGEISFVEWADESNALLIKQLTLFVFACIIDHIIIIRKYLCLF